MDKIESCRWIFFVIYTLGLESFINTCTSFILYKELVENLNQILNGEYPTALKQQVLRFIMVLATVSVQIF